LSESIVFTDGAKPGKRRREVRSAVDADDH